MSAIAIDISEFTTKLKDLIVSLKGDEEIIITASNQPVAKLTAVREPVIEEAAVAPKRRQSGLTKGAAWMSPDFNEPLEDFAEYMP